MNVICQKIQSNLKNENLFYYFKIAQNDFPKYHLMLYKMGLAIIPKNNDPMIGVICFLNIKWYLQRSNFLCVTVQKWHALINHICVLKMLL